MAVENFGLDGQKRKRLAVRPTGLGVADRVQAANCRKVRIIDILRSKNGATGSLRRLSAPQWIAFAVSSGPRLLGTRRVTTALTHGFHDSLSTTP